MPGRFFVLSVGLLLLALHFGEALAAINRTILTGLERNFRFSAAGGTGCGVHLFLGLQLVFAGITALFAALGLVDEATLRIEFLLTGGEDELFSTLFAH